MRLNSLRKEDYIHRSRRSRRRAKITAFIAGFVVFDFGGDTIAASRASFAKVALQYHAPDGKRRIATKIST